MANKRINELALRTPQTTDLMLIGDPTTGYSYKTTLLSALNLGVPTTRTITINGTTFDLSANRSWSVGTVTSVGLTMPSAFNVASSPVTGSGTIAVTAAGLASQYIRGDGTLADFPGGGGSGGASVSYYLNGSVNQGTIGGVTYYEMNKTPILGAGTNFSTSSNGYIASFLTDANDPALLKIPGGNWNTEFYFAASSGGGTPTYYIELYKYDGTTFTLIASSSSNPDAITGGTSVEQYFTTLAVPETVLTATDRLAIRIYVTTAGRTITLHTENSNLCQIITTFTTGLTALNGLTAQVQYFATGSAGTDFNISSSTATHTFNIPTASATNRGLLSTADWSTFNNKVPYTGATANVDLGIYNLSAKSVFIEGTASYQSGLAMKQLNSFDFVSGAYTQIAPSSTTELNLVYNQSGGARRRAALSAAVLQNGDNFQYLFPRQNGTFAMLTDISTAINGTTNWIPRFTSANTIGLSNLYDGSSFIGVFTATDNLSGAKLQVNGAATFSASNTISFANTGGSIDNNAYLRFINTGTATLNQSIDIVMRWQDGTYNGTGGISMVRESATARSGRLILQPIDSSGNNVSALTLASTGAATFSSSVTAGGNIIASGSGNISVQAISSNNFPLFQLIDSRALGQSWNIENGRNTYGTLGFYNGGEKMLLTASGNLGLGVTPSAWGGTSKVIELPSGSIESRPNVIGLWQNAYFDGTSPRYSTSNFATNYYQNAGQHVWLTAPSGTAGNAITFTQAMTLNASGNLGITGSSFDINPASGNPNITLRSGNTFRGYIEANTTGLQFGVGASATIYATITSSGNVGIGTATPQGIRTTNLDISNTAGTNGVGLALSPSSTGLATIRFGNAGNVGFDVNFNDTTIGSGSLGIYSNSSGAYRFAITSSGRTLIGTTTDNTVDLLQVAGSARFKSSINYNSISIDNNSTTGGGGAYFLQNGTTGGGIGVSGWYLGDTSNDLFLVSETSRNIRFATNGANERMRITSGGYLKASNIGTYVGSTSSWHELRTNNAGEPIAIVSASSGSYGGVGLQVRVNRTSTGGNYLFLQAWDEAAAVARFRVLDSGNVENTNGSYGTISDISLKENIVDATPKLLDILNLKVKNFNLKADKNKLKQIGFIAQEFEEVFPSMIDTDQKTGLKSIKTSVLIPILVKAIQEQQIQIEDLKSKLN